MYRLKIGFVSLLGAIYTFFRGPMEVTTRLTPLVYRKNYPRDSSDMKFQFICEQYENKVFYKRWYMRNKTLYSYKVYCKVTHKGVVETLPVFYYPLICPARLTMSFYPHECAIEACLDEIIHVYRAYGSPKA